MATKIISAENQDPLERDIKPFILAHEFSRKLGIEPPVFRRHTGLHFGEQAKYVQIRFDEKQVKKWGKLELIHITDTQFGHHCCKVQKLIEYRDWILSEPYRFVVFGGDMVDAAHINSPGGPYDNLFTPQTQIYKFCEIFAPLAHRVVSFVGGNHERRANLHFGDLGTLLATLLQIPYSGGQQFVDIHFGDWKPFSLDNWHGRGAARSMGAMANMIWQHMIGSDAHWCPVGHLHKCLVLLRDRRTRDIRNCKLDFEEQYGSMSSSFLEWMGSYAEVAGMDGMRPKMARAVIYPDRTWELSHR